MNCHRKGKLEAAVKAKEKMLQVMRGKPDPMQRAEGLQRDIAKLNNQTEPAVQTPPLVWIRQRQCGRPKCFERQFESLQTVI